MRTCTYRTARFAALGTPVASPAGGADAVAYSGLMVLSRGWAIFLVGVGIWTWAIWPRFALAIWKDPRSWSTGVVGEFPATGFLWIHAMLIGASLVIGTAVGVLGVRAWRAARRPPGGRLPATPPMTGQRPRG